jgi:tRNA A-37 threonylcarbamoyl transferase component Bud32/Tfp pilus assembly protein PilF
VNTISPVLRAALLESLLRDRAAGALRRCEEYADSYPGFEAAIAHEYAQFVGGVATVGSDRSVSGFEAELARDRAAGRPPTLGSYLARFPKDARRVVERLAEIAVEDADRGVVAASTTVVEGGTLGPFRIVRMLGRGGQGDVFLAEDTRLHRQVALKVLRPELLRRAGALERFRREASYASRLDHPGICSVYEADTIDGAPYVAMRYVEGETLAARIRRERESGTRPTTRADLLTRAALIEQAARAVAAAHDAAILHRDLKPANLVVTPEGRPVLLDFGLARATDDGEASLTASGDLFGTPAYMSPEQASGAHGLVDARTDVWALGVTLYEFLTLELPFSAPTRVALLRKIESEDPPDPRRLVPAIPRDLAAVVLAALEKEPDRRYRSAAAFADDLAAVASGRAVTVVVPGPVDRALRYARREPAKATLAGALVLALLATTAIGGYVAARRPALDVGAAELARRDEEAAVLAAMGFARAGHEWTADGRLRDLLVANPHRGLARATLLDHLFTTGDAASMLDWTRLPAGVEPEPDEAQMMRRMRGAALRALHRDDEAKAEEAALTKDAKDAKDAKETWPLEQFAAAQLEWHRFERGEAAAAPRALAHYDRAILLSPRAEFAFHVARARLLAQLHPSDRSLAPRALDAGRALELLWPERAIAQLWAAQMLYVDDLARAVACERRACELDPMLPDAFVMLSGAELALKHDDLARKAYEGALAAAQASEPTRLWLVHQNWGIGLFAMRDAESAIAPFAEAVRLAPKEPVPSRYLCRALRKAGRTKELRSELTRRVDAAPDDGLAWLELAELELADGDREAAHAAATEADAHREPRKGDRDWSGELDALLARLEDEGR